MFDSHLNFLSFYIFALTFPAQFQSIHRFIHVPSWCIHPPHTMHQNSGLACTSLNTYNAYYMPPTNHSKLFSLPNDSPWTPFFTCSNRGHYIRTSHMQMNQAVCISVVFPDVQSNAEVQGMFTSYSSLSRASWCLFNSFRCCEKSGIRTGVE